MKELARAPVKRRAPIKTSKPVRYRPEDEATVEDIQKAQLRRQQPKTHQSPIKGQKPPVTSVSGAPTEIPTRIKVDHLAPVLKGVIPGMVWRQPPFAWSPVPFAVESDRLQERIVDERVQNDSLRRFLDDPTDPITYAVAGSPDDMKALYFAAYLANVHQQYMGDRGKVVWRPMYGGFDNKLLTDYDFVSGLNNPTMIVLTNMSPTSTNVKLDKVRDLIDHFSRIPIVLVIAGEDPISFAATRLFTPVHSLAYFAERTVKRKMEIV